MTTRTLLLQQILVGNDIHRIDINDQDLKDLATSISQLGLLNPITVTDNGNDTYTLVAGHRRLLACQSLNRQHIDCTIYAGSQRDADAARFAENMQRAQLSPMEEAYALKHQHEVNLVAIPELARMLNRSTDWVNQRLTLTTMHPELCELVHTGKLAIGSALALANVTDDDHRRYLTTYAINAGAAVPVIREWVAQWQYAKDLGEPDSAPRPEMPQPGQQVVVTMPCNGCGRPTNYTLLRVVRFCVNCKDALDAAETFESQAAAEA